MPSIRMGEVRGILRRARLANDLSELHLRIPLLPQQKLRWPSLAFDDTRTAFAHRSPADLRRATWMFGLIGAPSLVTLRCPGHCAWHWPCGFHWTGLCDPSLIISAVGRTYRRASTPRRNCPNTGSRPFSTTAQKDKPGRRLDAAHDQIMSAILSAKGDAGLLLQSSKSAPSPTMTCWKRSAHGASRSKEQPGLATVEGRVSSLCTAAAISGCPS